MNTIFNHNNDKKVLLVNFLSLSVLQVVYTVLPLIILPYLVRVLGIENYGLIATSLAIIMLFNIVVSFGFELSATKDVSVSKTNNNKLSEIFSTVMFIKVTFLIISFIVLVFLTEYVSVMNENSTLFFLTFGVVIGHAIFPSWLFQGMEKIKYITYINLITATCSTGLIFLLVQDEKDILYVPLLNSIGGILGALYSLRLANKIFNIKYIPPKRKNIFLYLKSSYAFFLSRAANNGSRYYAVTLIGLYFGNSLAGYYSLAEKSFYAFVSLGGLISQAIYPYMCRTKNVIFLKKILIIATLISIILVVPVMYYNEYIFYFLFDEESEVLSSVFEILFFGSIFSIIGSLIGYPLLSAFNYDKHANNSLLYSSVLYIFLITVSAYFFNSIYLISASMVIFKFSVLILRVLYIQKEGIQFFNFKI